MITVGGLYRFRSGLRIITSAPSGDGVQVAQPYVRFTKPLSVRVNADGTPFAYPGRAYVSVLLMSHEMELGPVVQEGNEFFCAFQPKLIQYVPKKRKKNKRKKPRKR